MELTMRTDSLVPIKKTNVFIRTLSIILGVIELLLCVFLFAYIIIEDEYISLFTPNLLFSLFCMMNLFLVGMKKSFFKEKTFFKALGLLGGIGRNFLLIIFFINDNDYNYAGFFIIELILFSIIYFTVMKGSKWL